MAIVAADIKKYLTGGASNAAPLASIGGTISSVEAGADLFDTVSGAEAESGDTEYRCIAVENTHATLTATAMELFFNSNTVNPNNQLAVGLDSSGKNGTPAAVADESTRPNGVTFTQPVQASPLSIPDLEAGDHIAIWIRRVVAASQVARNNVMADIDIKFDTAE